MSRWLALTVISALVLGGLSSGGNRLSSGQSAAVTVSNDLVKLGKELVDVAAERCVSVVTN